MLTPEQIKYFDQQGYLHVKQFLDDDEVAVTRAASLGNKKGDLIGDLGLAKVLFSDKMLSIAKSLLGEEIVYFGDSSAADRVLRAESKLKFRQLWRYAYHNDARNDDYDFTKPYPIIRMAFCTEDFTKHSGNLKIRPRSHKKYCSALRTRLKWSLKKRSLPGIFLGKWINVVSKPKDLILWNLRTHHFPMGVQIKHARRLVLTPRIEHWVPKFLRLPFTEERGLTAITIGAPSMYLESYIKFLSTSPKYVEHYKYSFFDDPKICKFANQKGVQLRFEALEAHRDDKPISPS